MTVFFTAYLPGKDELPHRLVSDLEAAPGPSSAMRLRKAKTFFLDLGSQAQCPSRMKRRNQLIGVPIKAAKCAEARRD